LKNLPNEDLVHIVKEKIPAFLRIDVDVQERQKMLLDFYHTYQAYDMDLLDKEIKV
jgi:hypothetical protein